MIPASGSPRILQEKCGKVSGSCRNRPEIIGKIRKFSGQNTASTKSPEFPGTRRFRAGLFELGSKNVVYQLQLR